MKHILITSLMLILCSSLISCKSKSVNGMEARDEGIHFDVERSGVSSDEVIRTFNYTDGSDWIGFATLNGEKHLGVLTRPDGSIQIGEGRGAWSNYYGVTISPDYIQYGLQENGKLQGSGILIDSNGTKYVGSFLNGEYHGFGCFWFTNGNQFVGNVEHGAPSGHGAFYWRETQMTLIGEWDQWVCTKTNEWKSYGENAQHAPPAGRGEAPRP
jgi:hypothetical protein